MFLTALLTVGMMIAYAVPGFLLIKTKVCQGEHISAFAKLLLYVCQPALVIYSMRQVPYSNTLMWNMVIVFALVLCSGIAVMVLFWLLFRQKMKGDATFRIYTIASCMGNYGFMGVPIIAALLPGHPEAVAYSAVAQLALNMMAWSVGSAIISQDIKYMQPKKMFLNPTVVSFFVALPLFITSFTFPSQVEEIITMLARMSTPLCMIIMGMRLATMPLKEIFGDWKQYLIIGVKQVLYPLAMFALLLPFSIDTTVKQSLVIMMCCPVASVVLNFAEVLGEGQKKAASLVLLATILSAATIPLICLLL